MAKRRKRGDGGISLRKDGRWEGRYVVGYDDKGLPVTKNVLAKTKSECAANLKALADSVNAPTPDQPKPGILLGDWLDLWYQSYKKPNLRPNTQMSYERRIYQHIIPALGNIQIDKLATNDIQQFYAGLKQNGRLLRAELYGEGLSDQTVRGIHTTLHAALDKAVAEKLILRNPADGCRLPSAKAREMQVLMPEEIQRLLIQAKEDGCYELLLLELSTGLRRGEICALQWNDLNFRTGELRIERQVHRIKGELKVSPPKTKASNRSVILPAPVVGILKTYKKTIDSRWMFPSPVSEDSPRDPAAVRKRLQIVLERAECKKIRFHDLRHTFSTVSLEHGMDIKTLSTIIGHVSSSTTLNVYAHVTDEMRRTAAVKIDQGIGRAEPQEEAVTAPQKPAPSAFQAHKGQRRKPGTGCVSQINDHLWEGRYSPIWPDGKKHARNVYAHSEAECERLLAEMIIEMKAEIAAEKELIKAAPKVS
jgi:integrase